MSPLSQHRHPGLNLAHTDPETHRQAEETLFGFWVFLMSDLVLFALLFATYASMLGATDGGPGPRDVFELSSAALETGVLLLSSLTMGMASIAMKYDEAPSRLYAWLAFTLVLGLVFLGLEVRDFVKMASDGETPQRSGWLSSFYALVSTHGLHVAAGCVWLILSIIQLAVFGLRSEVKLRIMRLSLFWHLLDVVWIFIFSVVYLGGLA
ncbi:cytochrome c oxidase subunit 3 [Aureimonas phyllosphaerae]|uniref:Cytochrome bo(3) ubiquinol oxidase subunit 3 n=1 Tax=Aureimonas phyllosphaerae TaxID=1166078 RepID=A0A7W6FVJ9_9HYPH|nr:cytochrome c oxidase subunit 3 [Aureimonas phyllosphaerae]MBB3937278.1 cytochrome o ubiquinol oxidase subunit 3 [Aureimonas phyllosphaerae]MBB3961285.1 cytochrome o ubiquinol oxidase subunit 3 [Aureimonas phyllosphaerae]SFF60251.1 cytochrome o ubiquinol oxidase subunit 3 [Aureimonas phyllosphaerae]